MQPAIGGRSDLHDREAGVASEPYTWTLLAMLKVLAAGVPRGLDPGQPNPPPIEPSEQLRPSRPTRERRRLRHESAPSRTAGRRTETGNVDVHTDAFDVTGIAASSNSRPGDGYGQPPGMATGIGDRQLVVQQKPRQ